MENLTDNLKNLTLKEKKELLNVEFYLLDRAHVRRFCDSNSVKIDFHEKKIQDIQKSIENHTYSLVEYREMCDDLWIPTIMFTNGVLFVSNEPEYLPKLSELNMKTGKIIERPLGGDSKFFKVL